MPHQQNIYLDNNATTRVDERVLEAMLPYFTDFYANSTSQHIAGLTVKEALELNTELIKDKRVCCWEIVEVNPTLDSENLMAENAFDILEATTKSLVDNF